MFLRLNLGKPGFVSFVVVCCYFFISCCLAFSFLCMSILNVNICLNTDKSKNTNWVLKDVMTSDNQINRNSPTLWLAAWMAKLGHD